jgi:hypothetical protein
MPVFAKSYAVKYTVNSRKGPMMIPRDKIDSTMKWVEYSFDIHDMNKLLMTTKSLDEKFMLMKALDIATRKKLWHYRQDNFDLHKASAILSALLKHHG